jgi:hypothetical protein
MKWFSHKFHGDRFRHSRNNVTISEDSALVLLMWTINEARRSDAFNMFRRSAVVSGDTHTDTQTQAARWSKKPVYIFSNKESKLKTRSTIDQRWSRCWGRMRPSPIIYIQIKNENQALAKFELATSVLVRPVFARWLWLQAILWISLFMRREEWAVLPHCQ